jgi:hypothetical protein
VFGDNLTPKGFTCGAAWAIPPPRQGRLRNLPSRRCPASSLLVALA